MLSGIRLAVLNAGRVHKAALQAPANGTLLLGPLDFRARFAQAARAGRQAVELDGRRVPVDGPVDLQTLARYLDMPLTIHAGRIDNAIWATFGDGHLHSAGGDLQGADVALRVRPTQPRLDVPTVGFGWDMQLDAGHDYTLHLTRFNAELGQPPLPDGTPLARSLALSTLTARYRVPTANQGQLLSVVGDRVDLGILSEFIRGLPLPARLRNELIKLDPRGMVSNYHIEVERAKPAHADLADEERRTGAAPIVRYRFLGDLQGISFAAQEPPPGPHRAATRAGWPGVENLWGRVDANETGGSAHFDTVNAAVTVPGEFDEPRLTFDRLRGNAKWTITPAPGEARARRRIAARPVRLEPRCRNRGVGAVREPRPRPRHASTCAPISPGRRWRASRATCRPGCPNTCATISATRCRTAR